MFGYDLSFIRVQQMAFSHTHACMHFSAYNWLWRGPIQKKQIRNVSSLQYMKLIITIWIIIYMINFNTYVHKTPWLVQYVLGMIVPSMNSAVYIRRNTTIYAISLCISFYVNRRNMRLIEFYIHMVKIYSIICRLSDLYCPKKTKSM